MKKLIMTGLLIIACASFDHAESMSDGKSQGTANGMDGEISIELTVEDGKISDISVLSDNETAGVGAKALGIIADAVVENQSLAVDNVSGATISSMAMKSAIGKAITEAGGDEKEWKEREIVVEPVDETLEYDVVVVGAGLTGLTAA